MGDESDKSQGPKKKPMEPLKDSEKIPDTAGFAGAAKKTPNLNVLFAKYKGSPKDISSLVTAAEKRIKEFFEIVTKRVTDFLDNDLKLLKTVSKEELSKINSALLEYKMQLEKISQEKIKKIAEMKSKMQTRIMTAEEVQNFVKYFDEKMNEVKKITQNIIKMLRKNKNIVTDNFSTDLQTVVTDYSKRVTTATEKLFTALKDAAGDLSKSVPDKKTLMEKIPKMPSTADLQKLQSKMSNVLKDNEPSTSNADDSGKSRMGSLMPASLKGKWANLNLSKHFNSQTMHGRANVAKATYLGAFLYFLYWKFKKSKS